MKIREKLIIGVNLILFGVFFIILLLNNLYVGKVYLEYKKNHLKKIYQKNIYNETLKNEDIKEIEEKYDVKIFPIPDSNDNQQGIRRGMMIGREINEKFPPIEPKLRSFFTNAQNKAFKLLETNNIVIDIVKNKGVQAEAIVLLYKNNKDERMVIISPLTNINEVIDILRFFTYFLLILCLLASGFTLSLFSYGMAKPLIQLKEITNKMSHLDFSEKINIRSGDEIEELGNSINNLSVQLETNINRLKDDIKEKEKTNEIQRRFFSTVSHELKTPLAIIQGYASGLRDNVAPEKIDFYCEVISDEVEEMSTLITTLLNKMKYESKNLEYEEFDLRSLTKEIIDKHKLDLKENNITLNFLGESKPFITADKESIKSVLLNFFTNALSFVSNDGYININIEQNEYETKFSIFNSGSFIPEENIDNIWKPFYRVEESQNRKYGGTGLGLSIVSDILDKHSASYGVENKLDGVEFYFTLYKNTDINLV